MLAIVILADDQAGDIDRVVVFPPVYEGQLTELSIGRDGAGCHVAYLTDAQCRELADALTNRLATE